MDLVNRFEVYFVEFDPTRGSEIKKTRPAVIISPNEMNDVLNTVIVAPLTSTIKKYPSRVDCSIKGKRGQVALDQIRCIDKSRLLNRFAILDAAEQQNILSVLEQIFSP